MSSRLESDEFLAGFLAEAEEILARANSALVALDEAARTSTPAPRALRQLFRSIHTLKGLSSMVGVEPVVELSHETETLLRNAERGGGALAIKTVKLLIRTVTSMEERLSALRAGKPVPAVPAELIAALSRQTPLASSGAQGKVVIPEALAGKVSASEQQELASSGGRAICLKFTPSPENAACGVTITSVRDRLSSVAELVKVVPVSVPAGPNAPGGLTFFLLLHAKETDETLASAAQVPVEAFSTLALEQPVEDPAELPPDEEAAEEESAGREHVRVDVARLDEAVERLAALVVLRFRLGRSVDRLAAQGVNVRDLKQVLAEHARTVRDLRAAIMKTRLVPLSELLARVPLIARGVADTAGKAVRVQLDVGNAELDKSVAERVFPAIVHLLRNAVDHGIELPALRRERGKPDEGTLKVTCAEVGGNLLELTVADDGGGVDPARVAARARRPVPHTDEDLLELITLPGLSTREEVTRTSGRGIGMDIVRRTVVNDLGGELALFNSPDKGTTFRLRIPLSITILDGLTFRCGGQTFVVPLGSVEDIVEMEPSAVTEGPRPERSGLRARMLRRNGQTLPLFSLQEMFRLDAAESDRRHALIIRKNGERCAFEVDRMLGRQEVVVRPLVDPLVHTRGIAGSTDLGDGLPTLVLELSSLASSTLADAGLSPGGDA
ncbi:MAG: chemotaxis protein CheA [Myxococcaceae bacterium]